MTGYRIWKSAFILVLEQVLVNDYFANENDFAKSIFTRMIISKIQTNKKDN